jgi:hypothetical protein
MGNAEKYRKVIKMIFEEIGLEKEPTIQDIRIFMYIPYNKLCAKFVLEDLATMTQAEVMDKYGITLDSIRWIKIVRKTPRYNISI